MHPITITGFDRFGGLNENPSEVLVKALKQAFPNEVNSAILPTSYKAVNKIVKSLLTPQTRFLVMFGYSKSTHGLRLEQFARNRDNSKRLDNESQIGQKIIITNAPQKYQTNMDLELLNKLTKNTYISKNAGGYVCNHAYFLALNEIYQNHADTKCLFIHLSSADSSNLYWAKKLIKYLLEL